MLRCPPTPNPGLQFTLVAAPTRLSGICLVLSTSCRTVNFLEAEWVPLTVARPPPGREQGMRKCLGRMCEQRKGGWIPGEGTDLPATEAEDE